MKIHRTLTGNDLALAEGAVAMNIAWWRERGRGGSQYGKARRAELEALHAKLKALGDYAYPYTDPDAAPDDLGEDALMRLDTKVTTRTRAEARRRQRTLTRSRRPPK